MASQIELSCEPDGRWVAELQALPGLQLYGCFQKEALEAARELNAMLLYKDSGDEQRILAFYPGPIPAAAPSRASVSASEDLAQTVYTNEELI